MSFWSGEKLRDNLPSIVSEFDESLIDCASYRLRVGSEVYSTEPKVSWYKSKSINKLENGESFQIAPGQFATIITRETVNIPKNAIAFISIRLKLKLRGLVNVSGFHVDPGYNGKLIFGVHNAGPQSIHIREGDSLFLMFLSDLDRDDSEETYDKKRKDPLIKIPIETVNNLPGQVNSLDSLKADVDKLSSRVSILQTVGTLLIIPFFFIFIELSSDLIKDSYFNNENNSSVEDSVKAENIEEDASKIAPQVKENNANKPDKEKEPISASSNK